MEDKGHQYGSLAGPIFHLHGHKFPWEADLWQPSLLSSLCFWSGNRSPGKGLSASVLICLQLRIILLLARHILGWCISNPLGWALWCMQFQTALPHSGVQWGGGVGGGGAAGRGPLTPTCGLLSAVEAGGGHGAPAGGDGEDPEAADQGAAGLGQVAGAGAARSRHEGPARSGPRAQHGQGLRNLRTLGVGLSRVDPRKVWDSRQKQD